MLKNLIAVISIVLVLSGCQSAGPVKDTETGSQPVASVPKADTRQTVRKAPAVVATEPPADLWERMRTDLSWYQIDHERVDYATELYLDQPGYMPLIADRGSLYLYYIVEEVQRRGMPMELALVPLVESTLDPFAYSPGRAAGLWQIMPRTGAHLGLQQNWWFDGRRSVRDSTRAALDYLEQLYLRFDEDWMLALAAYNAGSGRVGRARQHNLDRGLPADYWSLKLPRETRLYVPKILALSRLIAEPDAFGLDIPPIPNEPSFEVATTGGQIELAVAAELAEVSVETLQELNPGQLRWATAPDRPDELLVPPGSAERLESEAQRLTPEQRLRWQYYTIRSGDNLVGIAKKFGTRVSLLQQANGIRGSLIRAGRTLKIPTAGSGAMGIAMSAPVVDYKVRSGDSLYVIARRYEVSVDDIVSWNSLDPRKYLQPGQLLTLYVDNL